MGPHAVALLLAESLPHRMHFQGPATDVWCADFGQEVWRLWVPVYRIASHQIAAQLTDYVLRARCRRRVFAPPNEPQRKGKAQRSPARVAEIPITELEKDSSFICASSMSDSVECLQNILSRHSEWLVPAPSPKRGRGPGASEGTGAGLSRTRAISHTKCLLSVYTNADCTCRSRSESAQSDISRDQ